MKLKKLIDRRYETVAKARAISKKADDEKRMFTPTEEAQWNAHMTEAESVNKEIDQEARMIEAEASELERERGGRSWSGDRSEFLEYPDGRPGATRAVNRAHVMVNDSIRALRHDESMSRELVPAALPDGIKLEDLSLSRMLRGAVGLGWDGAAAEQRTMSGLTGAGGGFMIPEPMGMRVIDLARNAMVLSRIGAVTVPMSDRSLVVAKLTGDPTPYWRNEDGPITESDGAFGAVELIAQVVAVLVRISIELLEDGENFGQMIERSIAEALALEVDRAGLFGTGVNEPLGVYNTPGINEVSMGANGAAPTNYDKWSDAILDIENANGIATSTIMAPRTAATLRTLVNGDGDPLPLPEYYSSLRRLVSNQIPVDQTQGTSDVASCAFVGGFENVLIGMRKNITIEAFRAGGDTDAVSRMQVLIRAYMRVDFAVTRESHITKIVGITA
jgi:HK97 family phage major capsid protein